MRDGSIAVRRLSTRRTVLQVGGLTVARCLWPFAAHSGAAETARRRAESVIFLWMGGGVTHIDSFDPKPEAPQEIRGTLEAIATRLPGIRFGEPMREMAAVADKLALIRTFSHDSNDHLLSQVYTLSGRKVNRSQLFSEPNIGAIVAHQLGPRNGLPGYIAVPGITRPGPPPHNLFVGGWLGQRYAPFCVGGQPEQPDFTVGKKDPNPSPFAEEDLRPKELDLPPAMTPGRLHRRQTLRQRLALAARWLEKTAPAGALDGQYADAFRLLTSQRVRKAFDLADEPSAVRDRYGRTKIGGRCLLARRLVEAGARFVMVDYGYDPDYGNLWDNHNAASQNFPHISKMCLRGYHLAGMDRAFAALLNDLDERGLLDRTLVVFLTEFGRTPKINARGGRDHWGMCGSIFFAGAGIRRGIVVGQSDRHAAYPLTRGYSPADVAATILHLLGIDLSGRLYDRQNRPHPVLDHGEPIAAVLA
ncbi:MAG: DUF1501 domain-containing protein [Planctomycetota bacterium]|nr:MAG: DUF1501 domain-containing protein [Planctomycetota bacterium]